VSAEKPGLHSPAPQDDLAAADRISASVTPGGDEAAKVRRPGKAQQALVAALRKAESARGRQGRLPRHVSYRRSR
jgi:hypothetical protein